MATFDLNLGKDYFAILKVSQEATSQEIGASWRSLAAAAHPDKHPDATEVATQHLRELNEARDILCDPLKRRTYEALRQPRFRKFRCSPVKLSRFPDWSVILVLLVSFPLGLFMLVCNMFLTASRAKNY